MVYGGFNLFGVVVFVCAGASFLVTTIVVHPHRVRLTVVATSLCLSRYQFGRSAKLSGRPSGLPPACFFPHPRSSSFTHPIPSHRPPCLVRTMRGLSTTTTPAKTKKNMEFIEAFLSPPIGTQLQTSIFILMVYLFVPLAL